MIFVISGFLGTDFSYLKDNLNQEIYECVIRGHTTNEKFISYEVMIHDIVYQFKSICKFYNEVYILGFSMGGMIACMLAKYYTNPSIKGVILINPAFIIKNYQDMYYKDYHFNFKKVVKVIKKVPKGLIKSIKELKKLNDDALSYGFIDIKYKTLLIISNNDNILSKNNNLYLSRFLKNKELKIYDENHDILNSSSKDKVIKDINNYILDTKK